MKILLSIFLLLGLIACSGSKSTNETSEADVGVELAETEEFSDEFEGGDVLADEEFEDALSEDAFSDSALSESTADSVIAGDQEIEMSTEPVANAPTMEISDAVTSEGTWTVSESETLMIIAFKIYGDYDKWREIARLNSDKLNGGHSLSTGMTLRYNTPSEPFIWNPEGNPYLIKLGDTLGRISTTTYGTKKFWRNIWDNNRPLIKDPNKIFAGFTLYTPILDREVANQ